MKESYDNCSGENKHQCSHSVQPVSPMGVCKENRKGCASIYFVGVEFSIFRQELMPDWLKQAEPASFYTSLERTHSLGTEFSCRSEEGTTATPAQKAEGEWEETPKGINPAFIRSGVHLYAGLLSDIIDRHLHLCVCSAPNLQHQSHQVHISLIKTFWPINIINVDAWKCNVNNTDYFDLCKIWPLEQNVALTMVTERISPRGAHVPSFWRHSCAKNVAGIEDVRYKNSPCPPGPRYTSHDDKSTRNGEECYKVIPIQAKKRNSFLLNSPAGKGQ